MTGKDWLWIGGGLALLGIALYLKFSRNKASESRDREEHERTEFKRFDF